MRKLAFCFALFCIGNAEAQTQTTSSGIEDTEKPAYKEQTVQDIDVPFALVDEVPVFPGCEDADDKRACFSKSIQKHISENFAYPKEAQEKGHVSAMFTVNTDGDIDNIRTRGPDTMLEDEAERVISLLPKMKPAKHDGKFVRIPFSIPITF